LEQEDLYQYSFKHSINVQIRWNDLDILGHVNNGVYQSYLDIAKVNYFDNTLAGVVNWKESGVVLARITIDYINPVFLEESIAVQSKVVRIGNKSFEMVQQIVNTVTGELKAKAVSVLVGFHYQKKETIQIPETWRARIQEFEGAAVDQ